MFISKFYPYLFSIFFYLFSSVSLAQVDWQIFTAPDKDFFLTHHLIDTKNCPKNHGKLSKPFILPVKNFCKTNCPEDWEWMTLDDHCHDLNSGFNLLRYGVFQYKDSEGIPLYSVVTAWYGTEYEASFLLAFVTPAKHWSCMETNLTHPEIWCTDDV